MSINPPPVPPVPPVLSDFLYALGTEQMIRTRHDILGVPDLLLADLDPECRVCGGTGILARDRFGNLDACPLCEMHAEEQAP